MHAPGPKPEAALGGFDTDFDEALKERRDVVIERGGQPFRRKRPRAESLASTTMPDASRAASID